MSFLTIPKKKITVNLEVFQDIPRNEKPKPTTISIEVDPTKAWPDSMRVAVSYLAAKNAMFGDYEAFKDFEFQFAACKYIDRLITIYANQLDKDGDPWKIMGYCTAGPKAVIDEPPYSICPRCGTSLWGQPSGNDNKWLIDSYKNNPDPVYCLKCGQRFKYDDAGRLAYTAVANSEKQIRRIKHELKAIQPKLATVD
ncbi:hypothetical protein PT279_09150 [Bifidobacterium sp. ESL0784]|uniref:hypothetical protein n=1 Tax=Bifidobacterium sp. ESL0784 TaxID=2983231 RepID=UPI0023F73343|nr:hypothetical protein [Bifidobacterium sp. ESL0784]MDF7641749.1 hypothetical protein [Bifidobacterium sp. ESL0784]